MRLGRSGISWGSYWGRLKIQSATSRMVRRNAPRAMSRKASTKTTVDPQTLTAWTSAWASTPAAAPPLVMARPLSHNVLSRAPSQGRTWTVSPWTVQAIIRGISRAHTTGRHTGRPRWKARI